jgi:hypothetical protein
MTKKLTSREKLLRGLKRGGYDVEKSHQYWTDMSKKLEAQKKEYEKQHSNKSNMNEEAPVHNEFKKSMGVGSYGDFAKRHGIQKTKTVISSLKKERDEIRKKEWAGPQHVKNHDFAIHGLQRAIGENVGMVGGAPANSVGSGDIAGLGVGPQGEPGVKLRNKKKVMPFAIFARKTMNK